MTVELRKLTVLEWVAGLSDERIINDLYEAIPAKTDEKKPFDLSSCKTYGQKKADRFDLDEIKRKQGYTGVDEERMKSLIAQLDIEQSLDDLLEDLD